MDRLLEFAGNHPYLMTALAVAIAFVIFTEIRRKTGPKAISTKEVIRLINQENAVLIDVREASDYKSGHIINAENMPLTKIDENVKDITTDKDTPVIAYCKSGNTSYAASQKLRTLGYANAYYLKSGLYAWQDENLPMAKP